MLVNWVMALKPLTDKGWYWGVDGKMHISIYGQPHDTPWLHAPKHIPGSREAGVDCGILTVMHKHAFGTRAAASFCMECYKVVICPQSLAQVHKIAEYQNESGWACKVGAERRNYTQRVWGAYFYCRGLEEGKERYKAVREWVDENLGKEVKVFLKRGCTEFEQNMGDSDKWEKIKDQDEIEKEFMEVVDYTPMGPPQADAIRHHVWDVWDSWDKANQPPITYHEEK